jgi:hypothetical protein
MQKSINKTFFECVLVSASKAGLLGDLLFGAVGELVESDGEADFASLLLRVVLLDALQAGLEQLKSALVFVVRECSIVGFLRMVSGN